MDTSNRYDGQVILTSHTNHDGKPKIRIDRADPRVTIADHIISVGRTDNPWVSIADHPKRISFRRFWLGRWARG